MDGEVREVGDIVKFNGDCSIEVMCVMDGTTTTTTTTITTTTGAIYLSSYID